VGRLLKLYEEKMRALERLKEVLNSESLRKAYRDSHSKRIPRPCGLTIHTGIGCDYACTYCYIYDMGFPGKVRPYPLKPIEMVFAIALNPYVLPYKTLAAYGSVTEPFHLITRELAVNYIKEIYRWLHLPSQASTKSYIDENLAKMLKQAEPNISILLTVITIESSATLEPHAPNPLKRFEGASIAIEKGLDVALFLRPIIPGITDKEIEHILKTAAHHGIKSLVLGSLRVTKGVLLRLSSKGVDVKPIESRLPKTPRDFREQITIHVGDVEKEIIKKASDMGFEVFPAACSANIASHNEFCTMCKWGPCGNIKSRDVIVESDVREYLEVRGVKARDVYIGDDSVTITLARGRKLHRDILVHVATATRLKVFVSESSLN
jgi:DNA repair photolyase